MLQYRCLGVTASKKLISLELLCQFTKHNFIVKDIKDLAPTIRKAFHIASEGRPGPVLVDITKDVTAAKFDFEPIVPEVIEPRKYTYGAQELDQAIKMIEAS
mgnify:CR=1 FL=1